jgi:hypothetical protein
MKTIILFFSLLIFINISRAQDTIFMKNGTSILAKNIVIGSDEINYQKTSPPNSTAIYSVFIIDVSKIKYQNGTIQEFTKTEQKNEFGGKVPKAGFRFSLGYMYNYTKMNRLTDLETFWRNINQNQNLDISYKQNSSTFYLSMTSPLGHSQRNWIGDEVFLTFFPKSTIVAVNEFHGKNEINLDLVSFSIIIFYGHTINYKKNLIALIEPGISGGFLNGNFRLFEEDYKVDNMSGINLHLALGLDWIISKHFQANLRFGHRFMNIDEIHKSPLGYYSSFYINPGVSEDLLKINWSGNYVSLGFAFSVNTKLPE